MEKFIEIVDESGAINRALNGILGKFISEDGSSLDYLIALNHDIDVINQFLKKSPSELERYQKSYHLQEEYNTSLEVAKERWEKGHKAFQIGSSAIKDIVAHKKNYEQGLQALQSWKKRQKEIDSFANYHDPNSHDKPNSPWHSLLKIAEQLDKNDNKNIDNVVMNIAEKLDKKDKGDRRDILQKLFKHSPLKKFKNLKQYLVSISENTELKTFKKIEEVFSYVGTRVARLKSLRVDWQSQGILAKHNANDLFIMKKEFDNFEAFLNYFEENIPKSSENTHFKKVIDNISINRRILARYRERLNSAIGWKIQAASLAVNLRCDDSLFALIKELNNQVFLFDNKEDNEQLTTLLTIPKEGLSFNMDFKKYIYLLKVLRRSTNHLAFKKWLNSRWVTNVDNLNLINVKLFNRYLMPLKVAPFVPLQFGILPDNWIRYWFFRTQEKLGGFWRWLRKILVGKYHETATLLNETYRQVNHFEKLIQVNRSLGKGLNLAYINDNSAFQAALSLPEFISHEKTRGDAVRPSWTVGWLLQWIPFLNRFKTYSFFSIWKKELVDAEKAIRKKCRTIAKYFVEDFETMLINSISEKSFMFASSIMQDLEKFITTYGSRKDIEKFKEISCPINILQKFDFLQAPEDDENFRRVNEDAVIGFLRFSKKYYRKDQIEAINIIVKIILREEIPSLPKQERWLFNKMDCLLDPNNKNKSFENLMNLISTKYIFSTGDDGEETAFRFVKRFAPKVANAWTAERQETLEHKFILLNKILSVKDGKEKKITDNEIYDTNRFQLRYKNYANYIRDIIQSDKFSTTQYRNLLLTQARKYVKTYRGSNVLYMDLLMKLCLEEHIDIIKEYCKKRFSYLLTHKINPDLSDSVENHHFYTLVAKDPSLIVIVLEQVSRKYDGENMDLAEVILTLNDPETIALYFYKRFENLIHNNDFATLIQEKKMYAEFLKNPHFSKYMHQLFTTYLDNQLSNKNWQILEMADFCRIIEIYGSQRNKETYRLLRIKRLLEKNNVDNTERYLSIVSEYLPGLVEKHLITLTKSKQLLLEIFENHAKHINEQNKWQGHFQYFIEFFLPTNNKTLLYEIRLKWLENFLNFPEKFAFDYLDNYSRLDEKQHFQNKEIPTDEISLGEFYGEHNLNKVRKLLTARLEVFNEDLDDAVIRLIQNYTRDNLFRLDLNNALLHEKLKRYQKGQKIMHCLKNDALFEGVTMLENVNAELNGLVTINEKMHEKFRTQMIQYQKKLLSQLLMALYDKFKQTIINEVCLEKYGTAEYTVNLKALGLQRAKFHKMITQSDLPLEAKDIIEEIHQESSTVLEMLNQFLAGLCFDKLHLVSFDEELINKLPDYLSTKTLEYILKRVAALQTYLSENDPLFIALNAFKALIQNQYQNARAKQKDLQIIRTFKSSRRDYPKTAKNMALKLIESLNNHDKLSEYPLFKEAHSSYQSIFLHYLQPKYQERLLNNLKEKIEWLSTREHDEIEFKRSEWICYNQLYQWLLQLNPSNAATVKNQVESILENEINESKKSYRTLCAKLDLLLENENTTTQDYHPTSETLDQEYKFINACLLIKTFGNEEEKKELERLLSGIAKRQRRAMMNGLSGAFVDHCLDVANQLLTLAGSKAQHEACVRLMQTWNQYRYTARSYVQELAINDAIPQYIEEFDNTIYQYFIEKHNLSDDFTRLMLSKINKWQLDDKYIEPLELLKLHPLKEFQQILREEAKNKPHGFFYTKPNEDDARKLFVSFCLTIQAHQLANIWKKRKNRGDLNIRQFKPQDISDPLSRMVDSLSKEFNIGHGAYNRSVLRAISKDADYFAAWSALPTDSREKKGNKRQDKLNESTGL